MGKEEEEEEKNLSPRVSFCISVCVARRETVRVPIDGKTCIIDSDDIDLHDN